MYSTTLISCSTFSCFFRHSPSHFLSRSPSPLFPSDFPSLLLLPPSISLPIHSPHLPLTSHTPYPVYFPLLSHPYVLLILIPSPSPSLHLSLNTLPLTSLHIAYSIPCPFSPSFLSLCPSHSHPFSFSLPPSLSQYTQPNFPSHRILQTLSIFPFFPILISFSFSSLLLLPPSISLPIHSPHLPLTSHTPYPVYFPLLSHPYVLLILIPSPSPSLHLSLNTLPLTSLHIAYSIPCPFSPSFLSLCPSHSHPFSFSLPPSLSQYTQPNFPSHRILQTLSIFPFFPILISFSFSSLLLLPPSISLPIHSPHLPLTSHTPYPVHFPLLSHPYFLLILSSSLSLIRLLSNLTFTPPITYLVHFSFPFNLTPFSSLFPTLSHPFSSFYISPNPPPLPSPHYLAYPIPCPFFFPFQSHTIFPFLIPLPFSLHFCPIPLTSHLSFPSPRRPHTLSICFSFQSNSFPIPLLSLSHSSPILSPSLSISLHLSPTPS